jgi:hypothetical protein
MTDWGKFTGEMERMLKLRSYPIAYKKLEDAKDLKNIPGFGKNQRLDGRGDSRR